MENIKKGTAFIYNNERSILNGVKYEVIRVTKSAITLEAAHGQAALIGLPTFRQPFNIKINDLTDAINNNIYSLI